MPLGDRCASTCRRRRCASAASTVPDLTWKQTLDTFSCTECGRCRDVCPAWATGKETSRRAAHHGPARPSVRGGPEADPRRGRLRAVAHRAERRDRQRGLGLRDLQGLRARVPRVDRARGPHHRPAPSPRDDGLVIPDGVRADAPRHGAGLQSVGKPQAERADWAESVGVHVLEPGDPAPEVLYWVGCAASFDERARARRSTAKLLKERGRGLRDPRPARVLHGRPGAGSATSTSSRRTPSRTCRR